jgi:predicted SAM-dependent methyltransferase
MIKLNIGCGGRPLKGYINVDMDTLEEMRVRYPNQEFDNNLVIEQYDIFNLPFEKNSVDEIRAEGLIEHLSFIDEPKFFYEIVRVLKPGGKIYLSTVDFETSVKQWLEANDDWRDFYRNDHESIINNHWFGTFTYSPTNRWGYLTATLFGSQNGVGQFHTNCYTEAKLRAIFSRLNLIVESIERFQWKGDRDHMLGIAASKAIPPTNTVVTDIS